MKYFKVEPSRIATRYEITHDNFEKITQNKYPYEQKNVRGGLVQYGVCPFCLNPIQLIGIERKIKCRPYGKHTGTDINGLPKWNQVKYEYCPFSEKKDKKEINDEDRLLEITEDVIELYELLKSEFDRVVYIVSNILGIQCSKNMWKSVLQQFLEDRAYCYPWLTESNLPYIFAYRGLQHKKLWKQRFAVDSNAFKVLEKHPNVVFVNPDDKNGEEIKNSKYKILLNKNNFLNLRFRFTNHKQVSVDDETFRESMLFCIDDANTGEIIFKRVIEFEETYFLSILNNKNNKDKRQKWLLDIANELMQPLDNY